MSRNTPPLVAHVVLGLLALAPGCGGKGLEAKAPALVVTLNPGASTALPQATVGAVYSQTILVLSGGTAPFAFAPIAIPGGTTLASIGQTAAALTGIPTVAGSGTVTIQVKDAVGATVLVDYQLTIAPAGGATLSVSPPVLPAGVRGAIYHQTLTVTGGTPPFTWSSTGTLPPGITLGVTITSQVDLNGFPSTSGTFQFNIVVTDSSVPPLTKSQPYTINVP